MTSSRFDLGSTSKTLNLSLLRFNERSGSENLGWTINKEKFFQLFTKSPSKGSFIFQSYILPHYTFYAPQRHIYTEQNNQSVCKHYCASMQESHACICWRCDTTSWQCTKITTFKRQIWPWHAPRAMPILMCWRCMQKGERNMQALFGL